MEFTEFMDDFRKDTINGILEDLKFIAQGCYDEAMRRKSFTNDSGALSSSIGWAISLDGNIVYSGGLVSIGQGGSVGQSQGRKAIDELARGNGIKLILVAGMDYASEVEARGFDVNTSGELLADEMISWWLEHA
ncbi:hypothetical protein HMPREF9134_00502 [Porphyromonas catoniae F0037]|uniref:Uncharacterized protein n=2 Tax=Porphyromonas catoniae TaxID=41976 RepID=L1NFK9_9PORP|nr:hypothetical protein HMPREF9134_00502 [Porphyromonas catoniae F0037]